MRERPSLLNSPHFKAKHTLAFEYYSDNHSRLINFFEGLLCLKRFSLDRFSLNKKPLI